MLLIGEDLQKAGQYKAFEEVNMYLTKYFDNSFNTLVDGFFNERDSFSPRANVIEKKDAYRIELELPGIDKKDVKVEVKDNVLTVSGERKDENRQEKEGYTHFESHYGRFERSWTLGEGVDPNQINAENKNGLLTLTVPKTSLEKKKEETKRIEVK